MLSTAETTGSIVKVSPKFQLVIPKELREEVGVQPGMKFMMIPVGDGFRLVQLHPLSTLRGIISPDETIAIRDKTDRIDAG